jgi:hypothetical protein
VLADAQAMHPELVLRDADPNGDDRRGYNPELAERIFKQIEGFGSYGFPVSLRRRPSCGVTG